MLIIWYINMLMQQLLNYSKFWKLAASAKNELQNESNSMTWIWNWDDSNWVWSCYRSKLTDISNDTWNFVKQLNFSLYSLDTNCAFLVFVMLDHQKHTCFILFIFTRVANRIYDFGENIKCYARLNKDHLQHFRLYFRRNLKLLSTWRVFNVAYKLFWQRGWPCKNKEPGLNRLSQMAINGPRWMTRITF